MPGARLRFPERKLTWPTQITAPMYHVHCHAHSHQTSTQAHLLHQAHKYKLSATKLGKVIPSVHGATEQYTC